MKNMSSLAVEPWVKLWLTLGHLLFKFPKKIELRVEGMENVPSTPSIIAMNHCHEYDFLPIRMAFAQQNMSITSWIKTRSYLNPMRKFVFDKSGNVPLTSKGYIISADYAALYGKRPSEDMYRFLRGFVDTEKVPEVDDQLDPAIFEQKRDILGVPFDPARQTYAEAINNTYFEMMQETLRLGREARDAGSHMHIYPQGSQSSRLTQGHPGVIQAAVALDIPIVPLGISGIREALRKDSLVPRGGEIVLRVGKPYEVKSSKLRDSFTPFLPDDERLFQGELMKHTNELMDLVQELVDSNYSHEEGYISDGVQGTKRFF